MKSASDPRARARTALQHQFTGPTDAGYVDWPQANLVPGVRLEQFESDLRRGDGGELRMKFCAVHSSAALAVNCFAPFKEVAGALMTIGRISSLIRKNSNRFSWQALERLFSALPN